MAQVRVGEITLFYEEMGQGEPLLLLHGLGSSSQDWELQMAVFARHFRVITLDLRGHGRSDKPSGPYTIPLFASDVAAFIKALSIVPAHIVGISLGGMIALQLAVDAPHLVKSLVIVNSVSEMIPRTLPDKWKLWQRAAIVHVLGMRRMGQFLAPRLFPKPEQAEWRQTIAERWAQNDKRAYLASMNSFVGWSVSDQLATISCPTLVIAADEDYWPVAVKRAYTDRISGAELLVVEDSHHATPIDQTEQFNTAVLDFLNSQVEN